MPRVTVKDLSERLDSQIQETARLREANDRLQVALREQAEKLRRLAPSEALAVPRPLPLASHCPVCFEPLSDMDPTLTCGHEMCHKCCLRHFAANATCPICRREATKKELWRFRHPRIAGYWSRLKGSDWPHAGDFVLVTTKRETLVGFLIDTSDEKESVTLIYGGSAWELSLETVEEVVTIQHLVNHMPPREDGMLRLVANA
jgi:hypothetical protein